MFWSNRTGHVFPFHWRNCYYKELHNLVEAARNSDYPIVILGAGPVEAELKAHADSLRVRNIYFLGFLPDEDKVALLELCYAVIFPSHLRSEAFGISLLEGAMYGKPLISSEIGTRTTYINIDGETGIVVPPSEPVALRQALDFLWDNPDKAKSMGERAEARYWELFTADRMAKSYVSLYQKLLSQVK
jgi:glycosyltransferase involved in cell wall biosynthesis